MTSTGTDPSKYVCFSLEELSQHNDVKSCWIAVHERVYDVTEFFHKASKSRFYI